ncbi:MAG: hypothetical protein E7448_00585 [Ruminococcaceae bacterium]|nr:hypothetical protein [Oscillospiraceae bacterium]
MKRAHLLWQIIYYILVVAVYTGCILLCSLFVRYAFPNSGLGAVLVAVYAIMFVAIPLAIIGMMRLSLLRWYIEPFAAAIAPIWLYGITFVSEMEKSSDLLQAFTRSNKSFSANHGEGWLVLVFLFLFGLIASFSPARRRGGSIAYRILAKLKKE